MKPQAIVNWSGGKDSAFALYQVLNTGTYDVRVLLTTLNAQSQRIPMHEVRRELLRAQAAAVGIPLREVALPPEPSPTDYDRRMREVLSCYTATGITHSIFGDIFLEDLKAYRESRLREVGLMAHFPLWQKDTETLVYQFIELGFQAIVVCVNADYLDASWVGRSLDKRFLAELPSQVDPCGERGEFHTFVFDGPIFQQPVSFTVGEKRYQEYQAPNTKNSSGTSARSIGFHYCDLLPG